LMLDDAKIYCLIATLDAGLPPHISGDPFDYETVISSCTI